MKKISLILLVILAIILTACATPAGAATQANPTQANGSANANNANNNAPLSLASQLALGTLKLKETSYPVTTDQAAALLPLWEGLRSLSSSTSFSQLEYDALVKQIQETMGPEQVQAITDMKLTQADIGKTMQALGLGNGFGGANANGTPVARTPGARTGGTGGGTNGGGRGGGFGGGDFPGGGFGGFPGGAAGGGRQGGAISTPATQATVIARQAQRANQANPFLASAVITFLQQLSGK